MCVFDISAGRNVLHYWTKLSSYTHDNTLKSKQKILNHERCEFTSGPSQMPWLTPPVLSGTDMPLPT